MKTKKCWKYINHYLFKKIPWTANIPKSTIEFVCPSIHWLAFILQGCKKALAEWAVYQSIWYDRLTQRDEQPITLTPVSNEKVSSYIICMFIDCERKDEAPGVHPAGMDKTCKLKKAPGGCQVPTLTLSCCETTVLTIAPLCQPTIISSIKK